MCEKQEIKFACKTISGNDLNNVDTQKQIKNHLEKVIKRELGLLINFESHVGIPEISTRFYGSTVTLCVPLNKEYSIPEIFHIILENYCSQPPSVIKHSSNTLDENLEILRLQINNKR